jgi:hypothetical protein
MIPKSGNRFSGKIMLQQGTALGFGQNKRAGDAGPFGSLMEIVR